ncbi:hypothetical protein SLEP1_g27493 [Rubroshorea leprosula]|uniref:Myb/SANT-like domain-containing protein n=1 Tax=Rubroshorea leprosula TaxID=152421 RepID=A0AAV5JXP4_9ROSI|nr:hypothetical protein SLEP1_g27493 [Rubroshorea leprosula]
MMMIWETRRSRAWVGEAKRSSAWVGEYQRGVKQRVFQPPDFGFSKHCAIPLSSISNDWVLWNQLLKRETGLGWNHEKGTIDATPQRWAELKAENKEYGKFEHHGLENTVELQQMFDKIVFTGETAWTPAAGPIPPVQQNVGFEDAVDLEEGSGDSDEMDLDPRWNYENSNEFEVEEENSDEDEMEEQAIEQRDKQKSFKTFRLAMGARDIGNSR